MEVVDPRFQLDYFPAFDFFFAGWKCGLWRRLIDSDRSISTVLFLFFSMAAYAADNLTKLTFILTSISARSGIINVLSVLCCAVLCCAVL